MHVENKLARIMRNTGPGRFLIPAGVILIIFGILTLGVKTDDYLPVTGHITAVTEGVFAEDQQQYDVTFTYTVDGKNYEETFSNMLGSYNEGDEIELFYDPADPTKVTNSKTGAFFSPLLIAIGVLAVGFGVFVTVKAFKKSKALDAAVPGGGQVSQEAFEGFKQQSGVTEYYFRFDGHSLKPGYLIEDANRNVLFEGKMLQNAVVGARRFAFTDNRTGHTEEHEVGHTTTQTFNNEMFSAKSWFKFDGKNVWDVLHEQGLRIGTDLRSRFPRMVYLVTRDGAPFARIETSSMYVHEEDEAEHKLVVPAGKMYYRFWTASDDFETLFLTIFAVSETEQTIVE